MNNWNIIGLNTRIVCQPDCPERTDTCHTTCEKYITWRKALDERNAKIRAARERQYKGRHTLFYHNEKDKE